MTAPNLKFVTGDTDAEIAQVQAEINERSASETLESVRMVKTGDVLPPAGAYTYDDLSNAERFLSLFGSDFCYLAEAKKWLYWDKTHWATDHKNFVYELALCFVKDLYSPENCRDDIAFKHAKRSNNASGIENMLKIVRNKSTITTDELDTKPNLFNCLSGTIDLITGEVGQHERSDYITKLSPYHYNPDASCARFLTFLEDIQPNPNIQDYLQQALGYSMSATYTDRAFFILYGFGRNGKSVFVDLFSRIFGNYSQNTTADSLMKKQNGGIPNDIARLKGSRFVTCSETDEGGQLNESLIKAMTGGDKMTARFLYGEYFDLYFSGKLWIVTNHKPIIRDKSQGFWDRLKLIPFTTQIEKEKQIDKDTLLSSLLDESSGILAWLVSGWQKYQELNQLTIPAEIQNEISTYRNEQDIIAQFFDDCVETGEYFSIANTPLYERFRKYSNDNGEAKPLRQRLFTQSLKERGFVQERNMRERFWNGFRLSD